MGAQYLIDTNAVIELLGGTLPSSGSQWLQNIINQNDHCLSVINQIELLGFNGSPAEMAILNSFIQISAILPLNDTIAQETIRLRKAYRIKLPDAIIAATALVHNCILVTNNISDFQTISGLVCDNAHNH